MVQVSISGSFRRAMLGAESVEIEAETINELLKRLVVQFPLVEPLLKSGIAVAINGEIYRDNWYVTIPPNAEVFLMPRIEGG